MSVLLDTHALLYWLSDDKRLSSRARELIQEDRVVVSVVTFWEIEIKRALGRLKVNTRDVITTVARTDGFSSLPISQSHVVALAELPAHHRDSFDRMLVAQARHERLTLVTRDPEIQRYEVVTSW